MVHHGSSIVITGLAEQCYVLFAEIGDTHSSRHWLSYQVPDALLEEIFALLWIRENVAQFGLEIRDIWHLALHSFPVVLFDYFESKWHNSVSKLPRNILLELLSRSKSWLL